MNDSRAAHEATTPAADEGAETKPEHTPTPWALVDGWPLVIIRTDQQGKSLGYSENERADREEFAHVIASAAHNPESPHSHRPSRETAKANAAFIVRAVNSHQRLLDALDRIHTFACYASEENTDARAEMLIQIGLTAREAIDSAAR